MKKSLRNVLIAAAVTFGSSLSVNAQIAMTRTTFSGSFSPITSGSGGGIMSTAIGDDATQDGIPIGFTFNYLGNNYTTMGVSTNGWASFNTVAGQSQNANTNIYTTTGPSLSIGPWWDDLRMDSIVYITTGTPGSQIFTMQWNGNSYYTGATQQISFQLKLYEGTNVIEFHYGSVVPGIVSASESASIGIEGATGGNGNYLDAVTGSFYCGQYYMQAANKWPTRFYRFTPGVATPVAGGTYTVGTAGFYPTIDEAVADLNHRGVSGPVVLSLTQTTYDVTPANGDNIFPVVVGPIAGTSVANTITIQPASGTATFFYDGATGGGINNASTTTACGTGNEPILALCGARYTIVNNINFSCSGAGVVDRGINVINQSAAGTGAPNFGGSQFNAFTNIGVQLSRTNTNSIGIEQRLPTTPTAVTGANSSNTYMNLNISNVYAGIYLLGNATFPDLSCAITNSSPTAFNSIGGAAAFDIGGGTAATQTYGIRCASQSGLTVNNNEVRNVAAQTTTDGILIELSQGTSNVFRNKVYAVRNNGTASTASVCGIRANSATTGTHTLNVYNNFVYDVSTAYTGAATATRIVKGIFAQSAGGGVTTSSVNVDFNNVYLNVSSLNASSTCYEIGTTAGVVINTRNNNFNNSTAAQTAPAAHYTWRSTSTTLVGNTGSVSNYNNLYVANTTQGFVGQGNATDYATLANWQAAMAQDANSISVDPGYLSTTDLHVSTPSLDAAGTPLAWVTSDIDNQGRGGTPDIGADEFTPSTIDIGTTLLVSPVAGGCYSNPENVVIRIRNFAAPTIDFSVNPVVITANITGAITATLTYTVNTGTLASATTADYTVGTINMSAAGTYVFDAFSTVTGDGQPLNDAMATTTINYQAGSATVQPASICAGSTTTLTVSGNTSTTIQWQESTDGGLTWTNIAGATTSPYVHTPTDTILVRVLMCGSLASTTDTVMYSPISSPVTVGDTICGLDTVILSASGSGTLNWYTSAVGGSIINTGTTYSPVISTTTTYYVENVSGGGIQSVGMLNNSAGGGQQTSTNYNIFDVYQNTTLVGAYVYPGAAGNVICELRDNAGVLITSRTVAVTAADINQRTYIALNIPLTPGTNYRLAQGTGSVSMFRSNAGVAYPYTAPGVLSITNSAAGNTFYYWFYDWQILTGCASSRVPVTGTVMPTAPVTISAGNTTLCEGDSTSLTASSTNLGYAYTWMPAATLSSGTGATVMAGPTTATQYIVEADSSGCFAYDTIAIAVNPAPDAIVTLADTLICIGESDTITAVNPFANLTFNRTPAMPILDPPALAQFDSVYVPSSFIMNANSIVSVCLDITHTWDSDMNISLISPSGTVFDLSSGNGGSADNYTNTCFEMSAATPITAGAAPFTGSFIPEGAGGFSVFNGENAMGYWKISVQDFFGGDVGTLNSWTINFASLGYTYSWTSNPVGFTSTNDTIVVMPSVTTDYILTVTDTSTGCTETYIETVMVNDPITLTMSNDSLICAGDTLVMSVTAAGGDGNYSYLWSNGVITALDSVAPSASTVYSVTVMDGCTTPSASDTVSVTVAAPLAITSISNDTTLCSASPLVLNVSVSGGDGNTSYTWSNGPTTALDSITSGAAGTTTVYTVTVNEGCGTNAVDSVSVTTYAAPVATVMSADTTVCAGDTVVAMGMATSGDGNYSYSWSNGPTTAVDSIVASASGTYMFTVTDGCGNTGVDSIAVNVFAAPVVTASNDTSVCYPTFAYLSSTVTGGDGNNTYAWSSGGTQATDSVGLFGTQMQYVTVTDGCGNSSTDSVLVTVIYSPVAAFTESTAGSIVTFTDGSTDATAWSWNFGDSQTSTQQNPSHTYASNGSYTVTLIVTNSCGSDTTTSVVLIDVGINDPAVFNGVNVYPNPSSEVLNVSFGMAIGGHVNIELFDVQGKLVKATNMENIVAGQIITLDVTAVESGLYMMKITGENASKVYKLNVQH